MLIGCSDCFSSSLCESKILYAYIPVAATSDGTGSYCPGLYDCTGGTCVTQCSFLGNMIAWLTNSTQLTAFAAQAWNTCVSAEFASVSATTPSSVSSPGSLGGCPGSVQDGSFFTTNLAAAELGSAGGNACATAQIVAFRMQGNLFIEPVDVEGVSEACLMTSGQGVCIPGGGVGLPAGTYYIALPPYDLCAEFYGVGTISDEGISIQYEPATTTGQPCASLLTTYSGAYTPCESPDPFFGSDPP